MLLKIQVNKLMGWILVFHFTEEGELRSETILSPVHHVADYKVRLES